MLIFEVFGRRLGIKREDGRWLAFRVDASEHKHSRLYEVFIPDELTEAEIAGWLDDIFHEAATARHPDVKRIQ